MCVWDDCIYCACTCPCCVGTESNNYSNQYSRTLGGYSKLTNTHTHPHTHISIQTKENNSHVPQSSGPHGGAALTIVLRMIAICSANRHLDVSQLIAVARCVVFPIVSVLFCRVRSHNVTTAQKKTVPFFPSHCCLSIRCARVFFWMFLLALFSILLYQT